jgi:hypothetical protein
VLPVHVAPEADDAGDLVGEATSLGGGVSFCLGQIFEEGVREVRVSSA